MSLSTGTLALCLTVTCQPGITLSDLPVTMIVAVVVVRDPETLVEVITSDPPASSRKVFAVATPDSRVPVSLPASGPGLLRVARALVPAGREPRLYGMHLRNPESLAIDFDAEDAPARESALQPMLRVAERDGIEVRSIAFVSQRPSRDIVDMAQVKGASLIVMG